MISTTSRVAIVTGGSGGIGRISAERLAADGAAVIVHYAGNKERADNTVAAIVSAGGRAIALGGDVADEQDMSKVFDAAEAEFGGVDVLVHTAGIMPLSPIVDLDLEVFDRVQRTNVRGTFVVDQLAAQRLREGGAIINFSTSVTRLQIPGYGAYAASKGAVEAITLILARELRGRNITVNAVSPGPTATPLFFEGKSQEQIDGVAAMNPMGRLGAPEDISEMVSFLAGPARWVNGQVLHVNGGAA
ncbi:MULTISPECIES: SDR family oxidoreductase [Brevibacterium]|uniref:3-oxoacyl-[acyl-carrier protein] reductase n=1 Tax=Brevibacterium antiquum CNRZ 918 TaxID=1255637 RepID=A0A2H1I6W6_9MICO|nr:MULTISPECIES: SDR family oxidoreductase [Brevibacterium]SMX70880.1 3-oxoacyl-[acyl-carrier protein] reductase [Brevibacterium antiquum CNRZ 918]HCG55108.1 KR domain-containing protein [Brevibacterium sp.]